MSLDALARAVADAAAYLSRMPTTPAPLERTDRAPWVWATAQAPPNRPEATSTLGTVSHRAIPAYPTATATPPTASRTAGRTRPSAGFMSCAVAMSASP